MMLIPLEHFAAGGLTGTFPSEFGSDTKAEQVLTPARTKVSYVMVLASV